MAPHKEDLSSREREGRREVGRAEGRKGGGGGGGGGQRKRFIYDEVVIGPAGSRAMG